MISRVSAQYVIELDGSVYDCTGDSLEPVVDLRDIQGVRWYISDLQGAISRTLTLEAPVRYVEAMVRRNLQEAGEFDEPVSVITHWKRKKGAGATDIFFTALPTRLYFQYLDQARDYEDNLLLFPLYSVLYGVLKRIRHKRPVAVVLQHDRFADLIIGTRKKISYANRCVAFDESAEQISSLWDMVRSDIQNTEKEERIKVEKAFIVTWVNTEQAPEWPEDMEVELLTLEEEPVQFDGKTYSISFLKALRMLSGLDSVSSVAEKASYFSRIFLPYVNSVVLSAAFLLFLGYFWYGQRADSIERDLKTSQSQVSVLRQETTLPEISYQETFTFVKEIAHYRKTPSFTQLVNDISESLPEGLSVDGLVADFAEDELKVETFAKVRQPFDTAYKGYQEFLFVMRQKGYVVGESEFNTSIQESRFSVRFKKRI
jgi:hypothetical protein